MSRILTSRLASINVPLSTRVYPALVTTSKPKTFSTTAVRGRGPVETTKDTLKKADRIVSDAAVKGIDKGEEAKEKLKGVAGFTSKEVKDDLEKVKKEAEEVTGMGKGKAEEAYGKAKSKAEKAEEAALKEARKVEGRAS